MSPIDELSLEILGFYPTNSSLEILLEDGWNKFSKKHELDNDMVGDYIPREYRAVIKYTSNKKELKRRKSHEYIGHGNFCEYSELGNYIVNLDKKIYALEDELFDRVLPKKKLVKIVLGEKKDFIKKTKLDNNIQKSNNFDYLAIIPLNLEQKAQKYLQLRSYSDDFKQKTYQIYEGFALWIEDKIGIKIEEHREGFLGYLQLKNLEKSGINSLLQTLQFKISNKLKGGEKIC